MQKRGRSLAEITPSLPPLANVSAILFDAAALFQCLVLNIGACNH